MMSIIRGVAPKISIKKALFWLLLLSPVLYITSCIFVSERRASAFDVINIGDTRDTVIGQFGMPSHVERPGVLFARYASHQCQSPCVERLWFENRLSLDIEAWSVELDQGGRVIKKSHWASP